MSDSENLIRVLFFVGIFLLVAFAEVFIPYRAKSTSSILIKRWSLHFSIVAANSVILKIVFPMTAVFFAKYCSDQNWGLLNQLSISDGLKIGCAILFLDLVIYFQHRCFHQVPLLWRLHRVHHADTEFDVTTGFRFHFVEIILSMGIKFVAIAIIGAAPIAVLIFEILLNGVSMFNHGNIRIKKSWDHWIRRFIVTPDMHRVHHSVIESETNSNYGFNFSWWDRIFKTYRDQPVEGHLDMQIGLHEFRSEEYLKPQKFLTLPLQ